MEENKALELLKAARSVIRGETVYIFTATELSTYVAATLSSALKIMDEQQT